MGSFKQETTFAQSGSDIPVPMDTIIASNRRDDALDFLKHYKTEEGVRLSNVAAFTRGLRRRIDLHVMPFLCLCYTMNFLDKILLNVGPCILTQGYHSPAYHDTTVRTGHGHVNRPQAQRQQLLQRIIVLLHCGLGMLRLSDLDPESTSYCQMARRLFTWMGNYNCLPCGSQKLWRALDCTYPQRRVRIRHPSGTHVAQ